MRACQRQLALHDIANHSRLTTLPGKLNIALRPQPASKVTRMYLQRLEIIEHPRFAPCELDFSKGLNAVLGKNGTGKTTLLKLLVQIANLDFRALANWGGSCELDIRLVNQEVVSDWKFTSEIGTDPKSPVLLLRGSIRLTGCAELMFDVSDDRPLQYQIEGRTITHDRVNRVATAHWTLLNLLRENATKHPASHDSVEAKYAHSLGSLARIDAPAMRFDEVLGGYKWLCEPDTDRMEPGMRRAGTWELTTSQDDPFLVGVIVPWANFLIKTVSVGDVVDQMWLPEMPFIQRLARLFGAAGIGVQPIELRSKTSGKSITRVYDGLRFKISYPDGLTVFDRDLSFGQKRLLAFYWYLACIPDGIVIADELVNGFHHDWIKGCLEEIGDRQAILATQSPLLLDYLEFEDAEQVRKSFVLCSVDDSAEGGRKFKLRNPTEEEGARFMKAYKAGYEQVNEILTAMGMW